MAVAAAVVPPALAALQQAGQQRQAIGRATRAGLQGATGAKLPLVGTADLEARVHETVLPVPFIRRDAEDTIRAQLRNRRPVLLIGSSMVGKTKLAARVIATEFAAWPVAIPDSKTALADLDAQGVAFRDCVIWLDDVDRLIGPDGITDGALRGLADAGNIIVATIRTGEYDRFRPTDRLRPPEWDVLRVFEHVFLNRNLTEKEQERLAVAVADPRIRSRIIAVGLGEYVGAAAQISEALMLGAAGTDALGYSLVLAAADWRRSGLSRPVPAHLLASLAGTYLDQRGQARLNDREAFAGGLKWATTEINPNVSLLQPFPDDAYVVYDYALDLISARDAPIPDSSWQVMMHNARPAELISIGHAAHGEFRRNDIAIQAWRQAAESDHSGQAPRAMASIGLLLAEQGDVQGARDALQEAIDSGHPGIGPMAAESLGFLLAEHGDMQGARDAYQKAIDSGRPSAAPMASFSIGALLAEQGDVPGAIDALRQAAGSGDAEAQPRAAGLLGLLLAQQGDVQGAMDAYQKAVNSGHTEAAPMAAWGLGSLLVQQGDVQGAMDAYRKAADSGHTEAGPMSVLNLGVLLAQQGDVQGAMDAYRKAADSGHADAGPRAARSLGGLLTEQGNAQAAMEAYQKAVDSGHAEAAPVAAASLGVLLAERGDLQGAMDAYQKAVDSGHANAAPAALLTRAALLAQQGDIRGAVKDLRQAADSGHTEIGPVAAASLGILLAELGDVQGAKDACQKAVDSGHAEASSLAAATLAKLPQGQDNALGSETGS